MLLSFYLLSLSSLFEVVELGDFFSSFADPFLWHVLKVSVIQATLSALLATFCGLMTAWVCYYHHFYGKRVLLKMLSLTFVLPSMIVILALIGIYGYGGWLSQLLAVFGVNYQGNFYGLPAILIAHLFFNIPFSCKILLSAFHSIAPEHHQLREILGLNAWNFFRLVEFPRLKMHLLSAFALVFMLCFTSFSIVLLLGGVYYTSLEAVIFQAVLFEFNFTKATVFALVQCVLGLIFFFISAQIGHHKSNISHKKTYLPKPSTLGKAFAYVWIAVIALFTLTPLANVLISAMTAGKWREVFIDPLFYQAVLYSLMIALFSASCALLWALLMGKSSIRFGFLGYDRIAQTMNSGMLMVLAVPTLVLSLVLSLGLFLWLQQLDYGRLSLLFLVVITNALASLPFVMRAIMPRLFDTMVSQEKLAMSLAITGVNRFYRLECKPLMSVIGYAFALAAALSIGDFTAIALFGSLEFTTLPYYLYQSIAHYQIDKGAVIAALLLMFYAALFLGIREHDYH